MSEDRQDLVEDYAKLIGDNIGASVVTSSLVKNNEWKPPSGHNSQFCSTQQTYNLLESCK